MNDRTDMNDTRTGAFHPVQIGHLVMGLAFLGLVAIWAVIQADLVPSDDVRWLLPLPWVFAGAAGLIAVVVSGRRRSAAPEPVAAPEWRSTPEERAAATAEEPTDDDTLVDEIVDDEPEEQK